jgi:hypothetical protein
MRRKLFLGHQQQQHQLRQARLLLHQRLSLIQPQLHQLVILHVNQFVMLQQQRQQQMLQQNPPQTKQLQMRQQN